MLEVVDERGVGLRSRLELAVDARGLFLLGNSNCEAEE